MIDKQGSVFTKTSIGYDVLQGIPPNIVEVGIYESKDSSLYFIDENRNIYGYDKATKKSWEVYLSFYHSSRLKSARK